MEAGLFPPLVASVLIILVGAISMVALVGLAYNYSFIISARTKISRIEELEHEVKALQRDIKELKERAAKKSAPEFAVPDKVAAKPVPAEERKLKQEVWQGLVDDYNNLANIMNVPRAAEACENFVRNNKLQMFICKEPQAADGGQTPVYETVDTVDISRYWAWPVTGQPDDFIVMPNPLIEYNEELHNKGGMKETFASNYETGSFRHVQVKLPAYFTQRQGNWKIVQPGVIRVK